MCDFRSSIGKYSTDVRIRRFSYHTFILKFCLFIQYFSEHIAISNIWLKVWCYRVTSVKLDYKEKSEKVRRIILQIANFVIQKNVAGMYECIFVR